MPKPSPSLWSPGKTVAWYGVIFTIDLILQSAILIGAAFLVLDPNAGREQLALAIHAMAHDGQVFVAAAFASATLVMSALGLLTRRVGGALEYLAVRKVEAKQIALYLGLGILFALTQVTLFEVCGLPSTDFWRGIYLSSWLKPFLFIVIVFAAPAAEEAMYRGFLFRGLLQSRLGATGTILLTSLAWAAAHMQYNLWEKGAIFVLGLLLGTLRYRRDSLSVSFLIHVGVNLTGFVLMMAGF